MYDYIRGKLITKRPTSVVVDIDGLGYELKVSLSTSETLPAEGEMITLKTYLHVREDILQLYGFAAEEERDLFLGLLSISGIGPKLAQSMLSGLSPAKFITAIRNDDEKTLSSISGVGKKTAQRLIVELKDKLSKMAVSVPAEDVPVAESALGTLENEAAMALISLGYKRQQAERALVKLRKSANQPTTVEEMIKNALQVI